MHVAKALETLCEIRADAEKRGSEHRPFAGQTCFAFSMAAVAR